MADVHKGTVMATAARALTDEGYAYDDARFGVMKVINDQDWRTWDAQHLVSCARAAIETRYGDPAIRYPSEHGPQH